MGLDFPWVLPYQFTWLLLSGETLFGVLCPPLEPLTQKRYGYVGKRKAVKMIRGLDTSLTGKAESQNCSVWRKKAPREIYWSLSVPKWGFKKEGMRRTCARSRTREMALNWKIRLDTRNKFWTLLGVRHGNKLTTEAVAAQLWSVRGQTSLGLGQCFSQIFID